MLAYILYFAFPGFFHFFLSTSQEIVWEEHPRNDLFCVEWDVKHLLNQSTDSDQSNAVIGSAVCMTDVYS